jgi:predicted secreted hydrolase
MMRAAATLATMLLASAGASAAAWAGAPPPEGGVLPPGSAASGFAQALTPRTFVFPDDHGPHPRFRQEWWYLSGNLDAAGGERFGFELTFFRFALAPPEPQPPPVSGSSAWRSSQIYMGHFAVTDVNRGRFRFAQKLERAALGLAGAEAAPLRVWIDDWSLAAAAAGTDLRWRAHAAQPSYQLDLELQPLSEPVLNGEQGLSRKSAEPTSASYYYSIPRMAVHGRLLRDGQALGVRGLAWLDREWGSGGLGSQQAGWDWYALQLNDGTALMLYEMRDRDGSRDRYSEGTWIESSGRSRRLSAEQVTVDVTAHWSNPHGVRYPSGWRIRVPSLALDVSVHPVLGNQELETTPRYWEGAVDVTGTRSEQAVAGRGYVELVGYAAVHSAQVSR